MAEGRRDDLYVPPRDTGFPSSPPRTPADALLGGDGATGGNVFTDSNARSHDFVRQSAEVNREIRRLEREIRSMSAKRSQKVRSDIREALSSSSDLSDASHAKFVCPPVHSTRTSNKGGRMDSRPPENPATQGEAVVINQSEMPTTRQHGDSNFVSSGDVKSPRVSGSAGEVLFTGGGSNANVAGSSQQTSANVEGTSGDIAAGGDHSAKPATASGKTKRKQLVLERFDGSSISVETFLAKYRNCSRFNGWTPDECVAFLRDSLCGDASQILWELADSADDQEIIRLLRDRFGSSNQAERFRAELHSRKRKKVNRYRRYIKTFVASCHYYSLASVVKCTK